VIVGVGGSAVGIIGGEGSAAFYANESEGQAQVGGLLSVGGGGLNVSSDIFVGYVKGSVRNLSGPSENLNISLGPLSLTLMYAPSSGRAFSGKLVGGTVGVGPGLPLGISATKSQTGATRFGDPVKSATTICPRGVKK
jgi:hypothetical protein